MKEDIIQGSVQKVPDNDLPRRHAFVADRPRGRSDPTICIYYWPREGYDRNDRTDLWEKVAGGKDNMSKWRNEHSGTTGNWENKRQEIEGAHKDSL